MEQEKKISFGFTKSTKKANIFEKPSPRNKIQFIDCVEAQTIKVKGAIEETKGPLVIPMPESINILDRRRQLKAKPKATQSETEILESELTADDIAARELIKEAQNRNGSKDQKIYILPTVTENTVILEGKEESTLEDYEAVPISDYGLAMLRGMGWREGCGIGKNERVTKVIEPELRPKGMGLGVTRVNNENIKNCVDENGKKLTLMKDGYAAILDGKHKGSFCHVEGFDDEAGRVIVKLLPHNTILSLNEFLLAPVTKAHCFHSLKYLDTTKHKTGDLKKEKDSQESTLKRHSHKRRHKESSKNSRHKSKKSKHKK